METAEGLHEASPSEKIGKDLSDKKIAVPLQR